MRKICMLIVQHIKPTIYGIFCRAQRDSRPVRNDESSARVTCITLGSISFATEASSLLRFRFSGAAASPSFSPPPHQQPMVTSPLSMTCLRKRKTNDQKKKNKKKGPCLCVSLFPSCFHSAAPHCPLDACGAPHRLPPFLTSTTTTTPSPEEKQKHTEGLHLRAPVLVHGGTLERRPSALSW